MSPPPHPLIAPSFPHSCWEKGPCWEASTPAYLSELLHASKNPHHAINLLLQAAGPVLHPASRGERDVRRGLPELQLQQPIPGRPGEPGQLLTPLNFHQRRSRHKEPE